MFTGHFLLKTHLNFVSLNSFCSRNLPFDTHLLALSSCLIATNGRAARPHTSKRFQDTLPQKLHKGISLKTAA